MKKTLITIGQENIKQVMNKNLDLIALFEVSL